MRSASSFTFEPLFVVLGIAALVAYARAWRREGAGVWHALAFGGGVVLIVAALNSPLETIAIDYLVLFHLLQNVIIADWAPPLLHPRADAGHASARSLRAVAARSPSSRDRPSPCRCGSSAGTSSTSAASTTSRSGTRGSSTSSTCS